jgi:restriction endonuclease S subunit
MSEALEQVREARSRRFRPYPAYKDSGVEWLGEIPAHWDCLAVARVTVSRCDGPFGSALKSEHYSGEGVRVVRLQNIGWAEFLDFDQAFIDEVYAGKLGDHGVVDGDLLVAGLGDEGHPVGRACAAPEGIGPALVKADCFRFRLDRTRVFPRFAAYQLSATALAAAGSLATGATRSRMNLTATVARKVALPVLEEQCSVAAFLDRETVRIDGLVARKERLIELLREKRSALITRAVTRGLDPSVPLKDSGVEWLGEIPAHWEVRRMKLLLEEPLQYGANEPAEMMDENLPRYIRITDISEDGRLREETFRSIPEDVAEPYLLEEGDLLFARSGATVGKTFRYEGSWGRAAYAGYLIRARLDPRKGDGGFLQYFTTSSSYWDWLRSNFIQATIQNVSAERYANLAIPVPGLTEQHAIVSCLDREKAKIDALVAKVREAIDRLKEFRTALISAAVTGKIDVREEVG